MRFVVLLLFKALTTLIESNGDRTISSLFNLTWTIKMTSTYLHASCGANSRTQLTDSERQRYKLQVFCPRCMSDNVANFSWSTEYGPNIAFTIPDPDDRDKGNYICWLIDTVLHRNVATVTEKLRELPRISNDPVDNFTLTWNFYRMSGALHASCCVTSKKVSFEHDKFRIDIESPIDVTMPPAHTLTEANDTSLTKTVVNRHPDNNCLGTFTCRLLDKSTGTYVEEISNNLTELPSEFTTLLPELTTKSQPIIRSIQRFNLWLIIVICIFGVISIIITAFIFLKIRHNRSSVPECVTSSLNFVVGETNAAYLHEELCNLQYDTRFEVDETNLMRLECIGGGHFSTVFNGKFKVSQQWPANNQFMHYLTPSSSLAVAIKVPGDEDGLCDIIACQNMLHDELKILCSVRSHPNIVTLVGAVTKADNSMCIIVEKCTNGSLLNFLKSRRETFIPQFKNELTKTETHIYPSKPKNILSNGLSTAHLISFSLQVALGMNHLTSMKCLHRDLAARNVLITDKLVCKIADFGLAKRVNRKDYYRVTTNYDLPVRWMSPETITSLTSTIESDIWSYGIVLYEIFTLGGCPYPTVSNPDVMEAIRNGRLNERPEFCPSAIYSHMLNCWNAYPGQRPSFANSAELLNKELFLASPQVLNTVEKELSREKHRQAELESLRSRSYVR